MKTPKTKVERQQFSQLSDATKYHLVEELAAWALTIWRADRDPRDYWMEKKSFDTIVYVLRDENERLVGSATLKFYRVDYEGRNIVIMKLGLGVDPEHRGNKFALRCIFAEVLRRKAAHPLEPFYMFSTLIHPVTYKLCSDALGTRFYPHFKHPDNPELKKLAHHLVDLFGVRKADSPNPLLHKEMFATIETQDDIDYWCNNPRPEVRFFVEHCPQFFSTHECLICAARLDLTYFIPHVIGTLMRNRMKRWRGRKRTLETSKRAA